MTPDIIQQLHDIVQIISELHSKYNSSISIHNQRILQISINSDYLQLAKELCVSKNVTYTEGLDTLDLDLSGINSNIVLFITFEEFSRYCRQQYNSLQVPIANDFVITNQDGTHCFFEQGNVVESNGFNTDQICYVIEFFRFCSLVRSISDYVDAATNTLVIYTSNKGVVKLKLGEPDYNPTIDAKMLHESISKFEQECADPRKRDFIKNSIIDHAEHCDVRVMACILARIDDLLDDAVRNFQRYLEEFSFEKFQTAWDKEKEKYFERFRDIITKITAQMANLPISLIAFVITANDKLTNPIIEKVFYSIFSVYVFAALWIQIHNLVELFQLKSKLKIDSEKMSKRSPITYQHISKDNKELRRKACSLIVLSLIIILGFAAISWLVIANCIKHI
jgi:hypothetical protein